MSYERLEQSLCRAVAVAGRADHAMSLRARMAFYKVPGMSLAIVDGGELAWTASYGEAGAGTSTTSETRFQAGSVSKGVAAACALRLVDQGRVSLDEDVNRYLQTWRVPEHAFGESVTLRHLLSHTAGTTVTGFPGYPVGTPIPTTAQVLAGAAPANTAPVLVDTTPGVEHRYSGGGYTVIQQLVEDMTGWSFEEAAQLLVLEPTGMLRSTFAQPLPQALVPSAAVGHEVDGTPLRGGWRVYPEKAAAGLWSTPEDLAHFALALQRSLIGASGLLRPETARAMLTPQAPAYGLGVRVEEQGDDVWFHHRGGTQGYRAYLGASAKGGYGVAVMANGEDAASLLNEVLGAVFEVGGWPAAQRPVVRPVTLDLAPYVGTYRYRFEVFSHTLSLYAECGSLWATSPSLWHGEREWLPESSTRFVMPDGGVRVIFDAIESDIAHGLLWGSYRFSR